MSQQVINCPTCGNQHQVEVFRSGGEAVAIVSMGISGCNLFEENKSKVKALLGLEEAHRQRVANHEMPRYDD